MYAMSGLPKWLQLITGNCERCNNVLRYSKHKCGTYWICSTCYYTMTKDQRESFATEIRDWDLIRKDRDYQDLD